MSSSRVTYGDVLRADKMGSLCAGCLSQVTFQSARVEMRLEASDIYLCKDCQPVVLQATRMKAAERRTDELKAQFLDSIASECKALDSGPLPVLVVLPTGESIIVQADVTAQRVDSFGTGITESYCRIRLPEIGTVVVDRLHQV